VRVDDVGEALVGRVVQMKTGKSLTNDKVEKKE